MHSFQALLVLKVLLSILRVEKDLVFYVPVFTTINNVNVRIVQDYFVGTFFPVFEVSLAEITISIPRGHHRVLYSCVIHQCPLIRRQVKGKDAVGNLQSPGWGRTDHWCHAKQAQALQP